jgi:ribosomal 50S subunit-recycling heat shock protein
MTASKDSDLRLDKWLWFARFTKSRSLATKLVGDGKMRINGTPTQKAHYAVKVGDELTFALGPHIRVIRIAALLRRRSKAGPLAADAETAAACKLDVPTLEAVMWALGYHAHGAKPAEESAPRTFAKPRRRRREAPQPVQPGSPFAALAGIKFDRR